MLLPLISIKPLIFLCKALHNGIVLYIHLEAVMSRAVKGHNEKQTASQ